MRPVNSPGDDGVAVGVEAEVQAEARRDHHHRSPEREAEALPHGWDPVETMPE